MYEAAANCTMTGVLDATSENSDVSLLVRLVAVALTRTLFGTTEVSEAMIGALPAPSVVTRIEPIGLAPWPYPDRVVAVFEKNSTRKLVFGRLVRLPWTLVLAP